MSDKILVWLLSIVFFGHPAIILLLFIPYLENVDTAKDSQWSGGRNDPFRYVAYDRDGKIRKHFKRNVMCISAVWLIGVIAWASVMAVQQ